MAWRISTWSREHGRGTLESEHFRDVGFDAYRAEVDDFRAGELVHVELEPGAPPRVRRVWPDDPRFPLAPGTPPAPALRPELRAAAERTLQQRRACLDHRIASLSPTALVLEGDDVQFEHGASDELVVHAPAYVDLPLQFVIKYLRVSTDAERAHLHAEKHELDATSLALTLIGDADQFYFIAGGGVSCRRTR